MYVTVPTPQKVRKVGNSLVVTIPADVAERHNVKAEDLIRLVEQIQFSVTDGEVAAEDRKVPGCFAFGDKREGAKIGEALTDRHFF